MISGAHAIIYSTNAEADRAFLREVLELTNVDAGEGWLIFGLPPAEVAFHPGEKNDVHELYLMCDDVAAFVTQMGTRNIGCGPIADQGWGLLTQVMLPGGGKLGVYQPRHPRPAVPGAPAAKPARQARKKPAVRARPAAKKMAKTAAKKTAKKASAKPPGKRKAAAKKAPAKKKKARR